MAKIKTNFMKFYAKIHIFILIFCIFCHANIPNEAAQNIQKPLKAVKNLREIGTNVWMDIKVG